MTFDGSVNLKKIGVEMNECKHELEERCKEQLDELSKSASFIMSLGAKELFHSNFLAFLIESDAEIPKNIQNNLKKYFELEPDKKVYIWRDKNNLDLVLIQADIENEYSWENCIPKIVIIENKLKSIPTVKQLEDYDNKLKGEIKFPIDFSLKLENGDDVVEEINLKDGAMALYVHKDAQSRRKKFPNSNKISIKKIILSTEKFEEKKGWKNITWNEVVQQIEKGLNDEDKQNEDSLITELIKDYVKSMENIMKIVNKTTSFHDCFVGDKLSYVDFYKQTKSTKFKHLRIHDLVGKIAFNKLEKTLLEKLKRDLKSLTIKEKFKLNSYTFYSRQQPGIGFEWLYTNGLEKKKEKRFSIGVQIQGDTLAHFVEFYPSKDKAENFANKKMNKWLYPEEDGFKGNIKNHGQLLKFDKKKFLYTKVSIGGFSFEGLSKRVEKSLKYATEILNNNDENFLEEVERFIGTEEEG